jgi:anti-sigma B factor antagonist
VLTTILDVSTASVGRSMTVTLRGELDLCGVRAFREAVGIPDGDQRVTIDLRKLTFLDATGIRQLLLLNARSRRDGFALRIQAPPYPAARIFEITGTDRRLPLE